MSTLPRRSFLVAAGLSLLGPRRARSQSSPEGDHRVQIDVPLLAEDATAVPVQVSLNHPMEPDHFIRSIEITVDRDPVPRKGKFLFTPHNGRPWLAFQMRSGSGGVMTVVADCTRHGRIAATRDYRVADGGCATGPDPIGRERSGNPQLRLPRSFKADEIVEVKARVTHNSHTGLALKDGKHVREAPELYIQRMLVYLDDQKISEFQMTSAVSPNPLVRFPLRVRRATLRVVFANNEGQQWEVSQPIRL